MFFWNKDKKQIQEELSFLQTRTALQANILEDLTDRLDRYEQILLKFNE